MLTLSYAEALADPTYCEAGHRHGKKLARTMGVKPNEPRPLKDIFPYCTVPEFLWCLRAVRKSQQEEANKLATAFISDTMQRVNKYAWSNKTSVPQDEAARKMGTTLNEYKAGSLSQASIDIHNLALRYFSDNPKAEEAAQRAKLQELINGA